jgi:hypothetical protein
MVEGGAYHSNKRIDPTDWTNTSIPILIARFEVDLTLNTYVAATQGSTKNYKYYDYDTDSSGWVNTRLDPTTGKEKMTSICVYKSGHEVPQVCKDNNDIEVAVADGGDNGEHGQPVAVTLGVRKTLGIATTCGESANGVTGDLGGSLGSGSEDIFVWGTMSAQQDMTFILTRNHQGSDAYGDTTSGDGTNELTTPNESTKEVDNYISISLDITSPHPITHDLLFIEDHVTTSNNLFSSHPGCNPDNDGKCQDATEYRIDINGPETDESTGGITISDAQLLNDNDKQMTCSVELKVVSGRKNHWHCFRDPNAQYGPGTAHDSTDFTNADGNTQLANLDAQSAQSLVSTEVLGGGVCTAQLLVTCTLMQLSVSGTDNRECNFETGFGVDAPYGNNNANAEAARVAAYEACVTSSWFEPKQYFQDDVVLEGSYNAAIVQAVRLTNLRRYPKDAKNSSVELDVEDSFPPATQPSTWTCTDACADEDPYKVLDSKKVDAKSEFKDPLTFITDDWTSGNGANQTTPYKANAVSNGVQVGQYEADHTITTTCTCHNTKYTGSVTQINSECCASGPSYDSGTVALENPPAGFPESYVFGIVSFDFNSATSNSKYDLFVRPGGIEDENPDASGQTKHTRLLRSSAPRGVQKTLLVNAVQNVINK